MFDWTRYLDLAAELAHRGDEAAARTAISRAYYALFHATRDYLDAKGPPVPRSGGAHRVVWNRLRNVQGQTPKLIAAEGNRLKVWRHDADYDDVYSGADIFADARDAVQLTDRLLQALTDLDSVAPDSRSRSSERA